MIQLKNSKRAWLQIDRLCANLTITPSLFDKDVTDKQIEDSISSLSIEHIDWNTEEFLLLLDMVKFMLDQLVIFISIFNFKKIDEEFNVLAKKTLFEAKDLLYFNIGIKTYRDYCDYYHIVKTEYPWVDSLLVLGLMLFKKIPKIDDEFYNTYLNLKKYFDISIWKSLVNDPSLAKELDFERRMARIRT